MVMCIAAAGCISRSGSHLPGCYLYQCRVIGVVKEHLRNTTLPQSAEEKFLIVTGFIRNYTREEPLHIRVWRYNPGVNGHDYACSVINASECEGTDNGRRVVQEITAGEAMLCADPAETCFRGGTSDQRGYLRKYASGTMLARLAKIDLYAAAFGNVVAVKCTNAVKEHQVAAGNCRARVTGQLDCVAIGVCEDTASCCAKEYSKGVTQRDCRSVGKEIREVHAVIL